LWCIEEPIPAAYVEESACIHDAGGALRSLLRLGFVKRTMHDDRFVYQLTELGEYVRRMVNAPKD